MIRYYCFLRAINVGGHTVTMKALKELFTSMAFTDVETFIASGNVVFKTADRDPRAIEQLIASRLQEALGYDVPAFVRTDSELAAIAAFEPFSDAPAGGIVRHYVGFTRDHADEIMTARIAEHSSDVDDVRADGREVYWTSRVKMSDSKISGAVLEQSLGALATFRNINTVHRLLAKHHAAGQ